MKNLFPRLQLVGWTIGFSWLRLNLRVFPGKGWRVRWVVFGWCSAYYQPHGVHLWEPGW